MNDRLALDVLVEHGPQTRSTMARHTGLSKPSTVELLDRLLAAGLIEETGELGEGRPGPNARGYRLVASTAYIAGVEVPAGSVRASVVDISGAKIGEGHLDVDPAEDPLPHARQVVADVLAAAGARWDRLHSAVIATGGIVDPATGDPVYVWGHPTWHEGLTAQLSDAWGVPVSVENEVNLSAVAEHRVGAARGHDMFAQIHLGAGVGLAVVLRGTLHRGATGGAGEIGYLPVPGADFGPFHRDGITPATGGFQSYVGGEAIKTLAAEHGLPADADPAATIAAARTAGEAGDRFLEVFASRIAVGAASVCAVLDPGFIVLGGDVGRAGGARLAALVQRAIARVSPLHPLVSPTELGDDAVLTGATMTGLDAARDEVFGTAD
ncbi:MAG: ROK family transcriptional regulator [Catenulisporales bacterium]|nr:ROK family transcriptional regulator [Catenulisporales bacterium]